MDHFFDSHDRIHDFVNDRTEYLLKNCRRMLFFLQFQNFAANVKLTRNRPLKKSPFCFKKASRGIPMGNKGAKMTGGK
jgi:hypothetical protein